MTATRIHVQKDRYVDSVVQMSASRAMMDVDGVEWAAAAMGTPANLETLAGRGFDLDVPGHNNFLNGLSRSSTSWAAPVVGWVSILWRRVQSQASSWWPT